MFRSIDKILKNKKYNLIEIKETNYKINFLFKDFLNKYFQKDNNNFKWNLIYNFKYNEVIINTSSKTIANELSLNIRGFKNLLTKEGLIIKRVIIN